MRKCLIFCHGWGGNLNFWNNLKQELDLHISKNNLNLITWFLDLGYFGRPLDVPADLLINQELEFIGIGHSLGLIKLLALNIQFTALIGLQSFINFLGKDMYLRNIRTKQLNNLMAKFSVAPLATLIDFYKFVGANIPCNHQQFKLDQERLAKDLVLLTLEVKLNYDIPILIVGAKNDPIVPPRLIVDNFSEYKAVTINILPNGGHGLGYQNPKIICQLLINFLYAIN